MAQEKLAEVKITAAVVIGHGDIAKKGDTRTVPAALAANLIQRGKATLVGDPATADDVVAAAVVAKDTKDNLGAQPISEGSLADKVRAAIESLSADEFTAAGAPDLKAVKAKLGQEDAAQVNAAVRDEVFAVMAADGFEVPQGA